MKKQNISKHEQSIHSLRIVFGVLILVLGIALLIGFFVDLFNGTYIVSDSTGIYTPVIWHVAHYAMPICGIISTLLGVQLLANKVRKIMWILFVLSCGSIFLLCQLLSPQVYLSNWDEVADLVNTAIKEYPENTDEEVEPSMHIIYGEGTTEMSKRLQREIDTQADRNTLAAFFVGMVVSAICCGIAFYKPNSEKSKK